MRVTKSKIYWCTVGGTALAGAGICAALFLGSPQDGRGRTIARGPAGRTANGSTAPGASGARGKAQRAARFGGVTLQVPGGHGDASSAVGLLGANPDELGAGNRDEGRLPQDGSKLHAHGAGSRDGASKNKKRGGEHARRVLTPAEIAKIREGLTSPQPEKRLAALRFARNFQTAEIEPDVRALLDREKNVPIKRVGAQVLALGDATTNRPVLERLRQDQDAVVRVNSSLGLARTGDQTQQAWLLSVYDASRKVAPHLVPVLGVALEDPELKSPEVIARFVAVANDVRRDPTVRARASAIVKAKLAR